MISPDMFPSTEMEISEKWGRSSANYSSENWKRNNEHLTMLKSRSKLQNWDLFFEVVSNDAGIVALILLQALTFTKKKENCIQFHSSKRQKHGFSVGINVQPNSRCKLWNKFVFRISSFCTNCFRSLTISFQNANRKWSGTHFSFTLAWNKTCQNDVVW